MITNKEIFEVERADYASFNERLVANAKRIENYEDDSIIGVYVFSKKNNLLWCGREFNKKDEKERYYIVNYPEQDEWIDAIGKLKIELTSKEEVQAVIDFLREHRNDGII